MPTALLASQLALLERPTPDERPLSGTAGGHRTRSGSDGNGRISPCARAGRTAANRAWVPVAKLATLAMTAPGRRIAGMLEQTAPQTVE
jgi:hypothetical protein